MFGAVCHNSFVIDKNNTVYLWGRNSSGQIGNGKKDDVQTPAINEELSQMKVKKVKCGFDHTLFLTSN
jgi:alpha-tubulin suppressor-like RCC1 family protein